MSFSVVGNREKTLGVLGNGQLGRMFCQAAKQLGYSTVSWGPPGKSPCSDASDHLIEADWDNKEALASFCKICSAATVELEQIPSHILKEVEQQLPLHPRADSILICQDRILEKTWLRENAFPVADFGLIKSAEDLDTACESVSFPAVIKTSKGGYDGRGQQLVKNAEELYFAWESFNKCPCVVEVWLDHVKEISVITAGDLHGNTQCFPVCENIHKNHILAVTIIPARLPSLVAEKAMTIASEISQRMHITGILTVEFFLTDGGKLLVNELAPRPHNSGHATIEACNHSQFDLQVLAVAGHQIPPIELKVNAVMVNLLGQFWKNGIPDFVQLEKNNNYKLHLYGKTFAKEGRKMGHITAIGHAASTHLPVLQELAETQNPALLNLLK